jgi:hypothetical protein
MWIMPSQLLKCAPDMAALDLDSKTSLANECEPSHIVNLRGSLKPISLVKWKRDSWMSHLYGTILKPSHTNRFTDWWTSSLRDTLASRSLPQENEQEKKTLATSGLGSQTEFDFFNQECVFSRTSKDTSALDSERSLESWNQWVTKCRGEYSLRVKSARHTNANECLSWPTIRASEYKDSGPIGSKSHDHMLGKGYLCAVVTQEAWQTPTTNMDMVRSEDGVQKRIAFRASIGRKSIPDGNLGEQMQRLHGLPAPAKPSMDGSRQESWRTPSSSDGEGGVMEMREGCAGKYKLRDHVAAEEKKSWATPQSRDAKGAEGRMIREGQSTDLPSQTEVAPTGQWNRANGKLNPRWVETLMGLPVGWTMPSCKSPVTIVPTNSDCWETESCQQQPDEHSELFGRNSND